MTSGNVRPNILPLTDADVRQLLADGIIRACGKPNAVGGGTLGPTRVGMAIGCDEKTVRRARDQESTLGLACAFNLLDVNPGALDALVAAKGYRLAPLTVGAAPDPIAASGAVIHKLGEARASDSPGGVRETEDELIGMELEVTRLEEATAALRSRIAIAKLRRNSV